MPIKIPNNLPAFSTLVNENIFVMADEKASRQDIRPAQGRYSKPYAYKDSYRNTAFKAAQ